MVIAAGQVNDVRLYRDLVASGIQDYLLKPFSVDQMRDALAHAQMTIAGPRITEAAVERPHLTTAVIGVRGGVGASSIASSIAWLFGEKGRRSTALLDLDVHFGTGALALDLEPGRGLTDAIENPSRIDGLFIERAMVKANDKLAVLSAEAPINQPLTSDGAAFFQLQEEMRQAFECTVIDLPRSDADPASAPAQRRADGGGRDRVHPRRDARCDPHPLLAEGECAADARCMVVANRVPPPGLPRSARRISRPRSSARSISSCRSTRSSRRRRPSSASRSPRSRAPARSGRCSAASPRG